MKLELGPVGIVYDLTQNGAGINDKAVFNTRHYK